MNKRLRLLAQAFAPEKPRLRWSWRHQEWYLVLSPLTAKLIARRDADTERK
jgi:hypothetical protein